MWQVRFAPAAAPAARPRAPPQPPAAPSADAAATPAADTSSEEEGWPDDTLVSFWRLEHSARCLHATLCSCHCGTCLQTRSALAMMPVPCHAKGWVLKFCTTCVHRPLARRRQCACHRQSAAAAADRPLEPSAPSGGLPPRRAAPRPAAGTAPAHRGRSGRRRR